MPFPAPATTARRLCLALAALLAAFGLLALATPEAQAAPAGWGTFSRLVGSSRDYTTTLTQRAAGFPRADVVSNSVAGGVGVQSGDSTWLSAATPVGAKYGSSENRGYLNLRPYNQNGAPPSATTYTFERPTPSSGWTFVLGDIDADQVRIRATGVGGRTVTSEELGFRSVFNYCVPRVCTANADVPSWDPATGVLVGNPAALDTNGASAWFEPTVPITSLTFVYAQRSGFPIYQTWFSALQYDLTGTVTAPVGRAQGITVELFDPEGNLVGTAETDENGRYRFPGQATYDDYRVSVVRPTGLTSDQPLSQNVDLGTSDQTADFALRAIVPTSASGTVRDDDDNPVAGVTVTLTDPAGGPDRVAVTGSDGTYLFDDLPVAEGYEVTATAPDGTTVTGPRTFGVPADSETPIDNLDFVVTPLPTGSAAGSVTRQGAGPVSSVLIAITGPGGASYLASTDDDGNWRLPDLPPGDYTATVQAPGGTAVVGPASRDFTISEQGGDETGLDFVLAVVAVEPPDASGRVLNNDGEPVAAVVITITDPGSGATQTATTDDAGRWRLNDLSPGTGYTAVITVPDGYDPVGATTRTFDVTTTDVTGLDFVIEPEVVAEPSPTPTPSPSPSPTTTSPSPVPTVTETAIEVVTGGGSGSGSGSSGSGSSGSLASTGGPSLLVGLGGVALLLAGLLTLGTRRRRRRP